MADLSVLIRLHKHELDKKRRFLNDLYTSMAELERQKRALDQAFEAEKQAMATDKEDVHYTFAQYTDTVMKKRKEIEKQEGLMELRIQKAKDTLMETFSELKKYEMTQEERERIEAEERAFKESQVMDAIGLEGFNSRKSEE